MVKSPRPHIQSLKGGVNAEGTYANCELVWWVLVRGYLLAVLPIEGDSNPTSCTETAELG